MLIFRSFWLLIALVILAACVPLEQAPPPASAANTAPMETPAPVDKPAQVPPPTDELVMLRANSWQWVSFDGPTGRLEIEDPTNYRVTFNSDASLAVVADCNKAAGSYQGEGGDLTIEIGPVTTAACPPGSRSNQFIDLLPGAVSYAFESDHLHIDLIADGGAMILAPVGEPAGEDAPIAGGSVAAVPFDLGDAVLVQTGAVNESMREMPIRLNGLIAAPPTGKNLPIAVIIHGSHGSGCSSSDGMTESWPCPDKETPHYEGFAYLVEALAARGYVAVSINANPAYVMAYGEARPNMRLPILVDQYLAQIAAAVNGDDVALGVDLAGRVDWNQLVVLGHSQGGEGVNWIVDGRAGRTAPDQITAGQGPIAAVILLAPSATATGEMEMATPFAVILPACDRDVSGLDGQRYYESARMKAQRDDLAASVYLPGANHNRFNSLLGDETLGRTSAVCDGALLPAAAQQRFLTDYALHFFDAALGRSDGDATAGGIDPTQPTPAVLFDRTVLTSLALPTTQRLRLPLGADGAAGAAAAVFCKAGYGLPGEMAEACRRVQFSQPGYPEQLALTWEGTDGAYEVALPEGNRDLSDYATLHLRAAVDPLSPLNAPGQPQAFSLRLTDGAGKTASVALTGEPALTFPLGNRGFDNTFKLDTWDNHVVLSSIRVPLTAFSGVDLGNVQSIALVFDATNSGAIFLTDLELLRTDMTQPKQTQFEETKPEYVAALEAAYGAPSQAGWGSAVFLERLKAADELEPAALAKYRYFVGELWERFGDDAWMGPWKAVYTRPADGKRDIIAELRGITDRDARQSVEMILDNVDDPEKARAALSAAFDDPAVTELAVYNIGDGAAMSGLLLAGRRGDAGEATFLVFLLD